MKHRFPLALAILAASLMLSGCDVVDEDEKPPETTQKDAYKSLQECLDDWSDKAMCTQAAQMQTDLEKARIAASAAQAQNNSGGHSMPIILPMFFGPSYSPGERVAYSNGNYFRPKANHAFRTTPPVKAAPGFLQARSAFVAKNPSLAKSVAPNATRATSSGRSSFGSTGRSFGGATGG